MRDHLLRHSAVYPRSAGAIRTRFAVKELVKNNFPDPGRLRLPPKQVRSRVCLGRSLDLPNWQTKAAVVLDPVLNDKVKRLLGSGSAFRDLRHS